jgi:hypothetical protein
MTKESEAIPSGVYYSADTDNFYDVKTCKGMGQTFWQKWRNRKYEFPSETSIIGK